MDHGTPPMRLTRRGALNLLGSGAGAAAALACAPTTGPSPAAALKPKAGGTLRVGMGNEPINIEPHRVSVGSNDTVWQGHDFLISYDDKLKPVGMLAETFETSTDLRQIKLNLRKGVQYHSGKELTSADVKYNLLRLRDPKIGAAQLANQSSWFSVIDTPDRSTVVLKSEQPRPSMFDFFEFFAIGDQLSLEASDGLTKLNGTGPFKLAEYRPGLSWRFVKNPSYWQSGRPYLDEVQVIWIPDVQSMVVQLEAGAIDLAFAPAVRDYARLKADPKFAALRYELSGQIGMVGQNTTYAPLADKRVRQALQYAVDRKRYADTVLLGTGEARVLPWGSLSPAYEPEKGKQITFDLDKAKSLLAAAGAANLELEITYQPTSSEVTGLSQILQSDLAKIGVKATLRPLDPVAQRDYVQKLQYKGLNTSAAATWTQLEGTTLLSQATTYNYSGNFTGYKSDRYTQLVTAASTEPDLAKRRGLYAQINDLLIDESFAIVANSTSPRIVTKASVHGTRWRINDALMWQDIWLE